MKILHVYDHTIPLHSGYVFRSSSLRKAMIEEEGYECDMVSSVRHYTANNLKYLGDEELEGEFFYRTKPHSIKIPFVRELLDIFLLSRKITELCNKKQYDILHIHSPLLNGYAGLLAKLFSKNVPRKIVYEVRAFWEDAASNHGTTSENSLRYKLTRKLETILCKKVTHIYPICLGIKEDLMKRGIPKDKMTLIPNMVNKKDFNPVSEEKKHSLLSKYRFEPHHKILGFIGSFYFYEGLEEGIEILNALLLHSPDYRLLLVGGGIAEEKIIEKIRKYRLEKQIILTGRVPHKEVIAHYDICDAMIYPRLSMRLTETTTPLKPLEAMLMKKLVLATNIGGHRELIKDGQTGILWDTYEAFDKIASVIHHQLEDKASCEKIIQQANDYVLQERQANMIVKKYYIGL